MDAARYLEVQADVRYWEDATVDGIEDEDGKIPLRKGSSWSPVIDLENGRVLDWPQGVEADVHYKVCDQGEYWLLDEGMKRIAQWNGSYVPNRFLCVGDNGYGDYIIFKIDGNGLIPGWKKPEIEKDLWQSLD